VQLYRYFVNQSSVFCRHNPLKETATSNTKSKSLSTQSENFWIHPRMFFPQSGGPSYAPIQNKGWQSSSNWTYVLPCRHIIILHVKSKYTSNTYSFRYKIRHFPFQSSWRWWLENEKVRHLFTSIQSAVLEDSGDVITGPQSAPTIPKFLSIFLRNIAHFVFIFL
jgi:hypothetical protein